MDRHKRSTGFLSFFHELGLAEHLCTKLEWRIVDLEAWGGPHDIEGVSPQLQDCAVEVKFVGQDAETFLDGDGAFRLEPAANYLLLRIYEAAVQLEKAHDAKKRIAVVILDHMTREVFEMALGHNVFRWDSLEFHRTDSSWTKFFADKVLKQYPTINNDLRPALHDLDFVWVFMVGAEMEYETQFMVRMPIGSQ